MLARGDRPTVGAGKGPKSLAEADAGERIQASPQLRAGARIGVIRYK